MHIEGMLFERIAFSPDAVEHFLAGNTRLGGSRKGRRI